MKQKKTSLIMMIALLFLFSCGPSELTKAATRYITESQERNEKTSPDREELARITKMINDLSDEINLVVSKVRKQSDFYEMLGMRYLEMGMYGQAAEAFKKGAELTPDRYKLYYKAGVAYANMGNSMESFGEKEQYLQKALALYQQALKLRADSIDTLYALSILYAYEFGQLEEAERTIQKAVNYAPADPDCRNLLAQIAVSRGNLDLAIEQYDEIISRFSGSKVAWHQKVALEAAKNKEMLQKAVYGKQD